MRRAVSAAFIAASLTLAGCFAHEEEDDRHATVNVAEISRTLKAQEDQWNRHYAARDAGGLASMYAPDAALANPGAPLLSGAAIRPAIDQFAADPNLQVQFASDRVQVAASGDLAYTRGHFTMRSTDPVTRGPRTDSGSYLTVWQRQSDNSWKAVEDFITPGPVAQAAPPSAPAPAPATPQ